MSLHLSHRLGVFDVSDRAARLLRLIAFVGGAIVIVLLAAVAVTGGLPRNPDGDWFRTAEVPVQLGLLVCTVAGLLLATRWAAPGAVVLALSGVALGALSSISHTPLVAVGVSAAFVTPSVLLWFAWQRHETPTRIAVIAVVTTGLLLGGWLSATAVHDHYFGPAHPTSDTARLDDPLVEWAWAGAASESGFTVVVKPTGVAEQVAIEVNDVAGDPVDVSSPSPVVDGVARVALTGLDPATEYQYRPIVDGAVAPEWHGRARTFLSAEAGQPITIAFSSCARTGSNGSVFDAIRAVNPDLYVITGDMHYSNIARNDPDAFAGAYDKVLTAPAQAALYRSVPVAYVWDDHDYSANDGDASAPSRPAARTAYERAVPHADLSNDTTINQAFSVGAVRVILLDTRSAREPGRTLLGEEQLDWLERELVASSASHDLVVLVSPTPWIGAASASSDAWAGFEDERRQVADVIAENEIDDVVIVGGDAHMIAIDDGSNSDYSSAGGASVPVLQAAALDRPGSVKGGPYSEGTFPGAGQFGLLRVERIEVDGIDAVRVELSGHTYDDRVLVRHVFEISE